MAPRSREPPLLARGDRDFHFLGDLGGELALERQHVTQRAIVTARPQVHVAGRVDELCRHADAIAGAGDRPFDNQIGAELFGDLRDRLLLLPVLHHRRARDHAEALQLREIRDERLGHAVSEIVLLRLGGEVRQRQHRQRDPAVVAP